MRFAVPEECPLLELPRQLRDRVYRAVYRDVGECVLLIMGLENSVERLRSEQDQYNSCDDAFEPWATALLNTCKQVYHEAAPVLMGMAYFRIILAGPLSYMPRGKVLGNVASCWFLPWIRRVRLTLANDFEIMLHNLDLLMERQKDNRRLDVQAVYLDFNFSITGIGPPHNFFDTKAEPLIERLRILPRLATLQVYNMSLPGSFLISDEQMASIVAGSGGKDFTFPEREQKNPWLPKGRHPRQEVQQIIADEQGWMDYS